MSNYLVLFQTQQAIYRHSRVSEHRTPAIPTKVATVYPATMVGMKSAFDNILNGYKSWIVTLKDVEPPTDDTPLIQLCETYIAEGKCRKVRA